MVIWLVVGVVYFEARIANPPPHKNYFIYPSNGDKKEPVTEIESLKEILLELKLEVSEIKEQRVQ